VSSARPENLPQTGHPGEHEVALHVPRLKAFEVALREGTRSDERHLSAQHIRKLGQLIEREPAQAPADPSAPRIAADL